MPTNWWVHRKATPQRRKTTLDQSITLAPTIRLHHRDTYAQYGIQISCALVMNCALSAELTLRDPEFSGQQHEKLSNDKY